jgi:hypothetical protein
MKKSDVFRFASYVVMGDKTLNSEDKAKILRVLFEEEDLALFVEKEELKKQEKENG